MIPALLKRPAVLSLLGLPEPEQPDDATLAKYIQKKEIFVYNSIADIGNSCMLVAGVASVAYMIAPSSLKLCIFVIGGLHQIGARHSLPIIENRPNAEHNPRMEVRNRRELVWLSAKDRFGIENQTFLSKTGEIWKQFTSIFGYDIWINRLPHTTPNPIKA